ncbi:hypothetical protein DMENIID0001_149560 [Sergentomyia squamirostris]
MGGDVNDKGTGGDDMQVDGAQSASVEEKRVRQYGKLAIAPFTVYIRAIKPHTLNTIAISNALFKKYESISRIEPVNRDKLRVVFSSKDDANALPNDDEFCNKYYVYIPSLKTEVDGKIILNVDEDASGFKDGYGTWDNSIVKVKVLEVTRLKRRIKANENEIIVPASFVRITFEGEILPDYVIVDRLRVKVVPYSPRVMKCSNCLLANHTEKHCGSRKRCEKCGDIHTDDQVQCDATAFKCPNCGLFYSEKNHSCPKFDQLKAERVSRVLEIKSKNFSQNSREQSQHKVPSKDKVAQSIAIDVSPIRTTNRFDRLDTEDADIISISDDEDTPNSNNQGAHGPARHTGTIPKPSRKRSFNASDSKEEQEAFTWADLFDRQAPRKNPRVVSPQRQTKNELSGDTRDELQKKLKGSTWKYMILAVAKYLNLGDSFMSLLEDVILPCLENLFEALIPKMLKFLWAPGTSHDD